MITVKDLQDQTGTSDRSVLMCACCGAEYSANKGDYSFWMSPTEVFTCCDEPMTLVRKRVCYEQVSP
jgi:hypothetical protein